jgi:hypothetical protein
MGLPWEFHEQCRADLELQHLQRIYVNANNYFRTAVPGAAQMEPSDAGVAKTCLSIMSAVMGWKFRDPRLRVARLPGALGQRNKHRMIEASSTG